MDQITATVGVWALAEVQQKKDDLSACHSAPAHPSLILTVLFQHPHIYQYFSTDCPSRSPGQRAGAPGRLWGTNIMTVNAL